MSAAPLISIVGVEKRYDGPQPLRVARLTVGPGERIALGGLDTGAAETFVHLVTGAALPESGEVEIGGVNTRAIATDTAWLASLDRFGIVTERAVLVDQLPVISNLALPITLSIDPLPADVRREVQALASEVGLAAGRLEQPVRELTPLERLRLHLARAVAPRPELLILEHPTAALRDRAQAAELGRAVERVTGARGLAIVALTGDDGFARASGAVRYRLDRERGVVRRRQFWQSL
jgi:ABC-type sugar transport system ATPase subunit